MDNAFHPRCLPRRVTGSGLALGLLLAVGCSDNTRGVLPPLFQPVGTAPVAAVTQTVGRPPLQGRLELTPPPGGTGWRFEIDLTGDGTSDTTGLVGEPLAFDYRFEIPGTYTLRVKVTGPDGPEIHQWPVVVADDSRVRVLARIRLMESPNASLAGIAVDREGKSVFVSEYSSATLWRLDAQTLEPLDLLRLDSGVTALAGLSITPSDSLLFAIHGSDDIDVISLPRWELVSSTNGLSGGDHIYAVDDSLAYASGDIPAATLLNVYTGNHRAALPWSRPYNHFDVSPRGDLFAVANWGENPPVIIVADQGTLIVRRKILVPTFVSALAFDATGQRLFASVYRDHGDGSSSDRLVTVDPYSGEIVQDLWGGRRMGLSDCIGNPTARSSSGRWIVFACRGLTVIDAMTGFPVAIIEDTALGIAAGPGDRFYVIGVDASVEKIEIVD